MMLSRTGWGETSLPVAFQNVGGRRAPWGCAAEAPYRGTASPPPPPVCAVFRRVLVWVLCGVCVCWACGVCVCVCVCGVWVQVGGFCGISYLLWFFSSADMVTIKGRKQNPVNV